jgi:hypothetical protein
MMDRSQRGGRSVGACLAAIVMLGAAVGMGTVPVRGESIQELTLGGLSFGNVEGLILESQDVAVSLDAVKMTYRLTNTTGRKAQVEIDFTLPDVDMGDQDTVYDLPGSGTRLVAFTTTANGAPLRFSSEQKAYSDSSDVTDVLARNRLPILPLGPVLQDLQRRLSEMTGDARADLLRRGIIYEAGTDVAGKPLHFPNWSVRTRHKSRWEIAAGQNAQIQLSYRPSIGRSTDTVLRKALRSKPSLKPQFEEKLASYCIEPDFLRGVDRLAGTGDANTAALQEWRISVGLSAATGFAQPARLFQLSIDKGKTARLVSFCANDVQKTSTTVFQSRKSNFNPTADLRIIWVGPGG